MVKALLRASGRYSAAVLAVAAGIVIIARYFQPAIFSRMVFPVLVVLACVCAALEIVNKRYE